MKKVLSLLLVICVLFSMVAIPASAAGSITVTYDCNAGTYLGAGARTDNGVSTSEPYTIKDAYNAGVTRAGYELRSWNTAPNGTGTTYEIGEQYTITNDIILYAVWQLLPTGRHTLVYNGTPGRFPNGMQYLSTDYAKGTMLTVQNYTQLGLSNPGYIFNGWFTEPSGRGTKYEIGTTFELNGDLVLYAYWSATSNFAAVLYFANNGIDAVPYHESGILINSEYTFTTCPFSYAGHTFVSWNTAADGSGTTYRAGDTFVLSTTPFTVYAQWEKSTTPPGQDVTLSYNANGATSGTAPAGGSYASGAQVTVSARGDLVRTGYTFSSWNTAADGSGTSYAVGASITLNTNVTLYAQWLAIGEVMLSYDANGATSGTVPVGGSYASGTLVTVSARGDLVRTGYAFSGWNTAANGSGASYAAGASITLTASVTLYAQWLAVDEVTLSYDANGATSGTAPSGGSYALGTQVTVSARGSLSRSGYSFRGWNTAANGSGTSYGVGESITLNEDTTLYAQWRANGGEIPTNPTEPDDGDQRGVLETGDHIKYLFGYVDKSVRADSDITRSEAASIFFRLLNSSAHNDRFAAVPNQFSDVREDAWYAQAVNYLASIGVILGFPDGTFAPEAKITRAEFAAIASRFDNLSLSDENIFIDVPETYWAIRYINSAATKGWVSGYSDSTFRPERAITRGEVVTIVNTMLQRAIDSEALAKVTNPYNDIVPEHWAYEAVIEASIEHEYTQDQDGKEKWMTE